LSVYYIIREEKFEGEKKWTERGMGRNGLGEMLWTRLPTSIQHLGSGHIYSAVTAADCTEGEAVSETRIDDPIILVKYSIRTCLLKMEAR
jgi:hypothetical protein